MGAGPGDARLLTLRAVEVISRADAILYDRLVDPSVLSLARRGCELVYAGKDPSDDPSLQGRINERMLELCLRHRLVVRLKGGDPFVFGRGGEEALFLAERGVEVEVVPGLSSALAAPALSGIPLTHRDLSSSFHVFTARLSGGRPREDWDRIASLEGTLVFLMGVGLLEEMASNLLRFGKDPDTPCSVICSSSTPFEEVVVGPLREIASLARERRLSPPGVLVVGEVVSLRERVKPPRRGPLFGVLAFLFRPLGYPDEFEERIRELGGRAVNVPLLEVRRIWPNPALERALARGLSDRWVVFASAMGVRFFAEGLLELGSDLRALGGARVAAIGPGTERALRSFGIAADLVPRSYNSVALGEEISSAPGPSRALLLRSSLADEGLRARLEGRGFEVEQVPLYELVEVEWTRSWAVEAISRSDRPYLIFSSASSARAFGSLLLGGLSLPEGSRVVSIGPATSAALREVGLSPHLEASTSTFDGLLEVLIEDVEQEKTKEA